MVMSIRTPSVWLDANGNPAEGFQVYIAQPNSDPKDPAKQLTLTDSASGEVVSNPFTINPEGYPKNNNGQVVLPVIQEQEYSVLMVSKYGGIQYPYPSVKSDAFGIVGGGSGVAMVDEVYNNFPAALAADLTGLFSIFIKSKTIGWEGTASGPSYPYYSAYTGGVGPAGTGTFDLFYDSQGNEWKITENSQLPLTNEADIATNAAAIAVNAVAITDNANAILAITKLDTIITADDPAWAPNAKTYAIEFTAVAGGGGGGGTRGSLGINQMAPCGGGGGWCKKLYSETIESSYSVTIGAGGAGGVVVGVGTGNGGTGGDTIVSGGALLMTANGGAGGEGLSVLLTFPVANTLGGISSGGDINSVGGAGKLHSNGAGLLLNSSISGGSNGSGGYVVTDTGAGKTGVGVGCGGGGAFATGGAANLDGGDGVGGHVIITEYIR